ncbi:MAG: GIY-YIG nuclease family protein [Desulfurococcales archaeon]|nr:GIY-YIG nuclease family protein [Desulfurococcales archaeon]
MNSGTHSRAKAEAGYVLVIKCESRVSLGIESLGNPTLSEGMYLYVGSANIPNPLTRDLRHFRKSKKIRWHIDYVTSVCTPLYAFLVFGLSESSLYVLLSKSFPPAVKGFGCTDKRDHETHLLRVSGGFDARSLMNQLLDLGVEGIEVVAGEMN